MTVSGPKPSWLRRRLPPVGKLAAVQKALCEGGLHTVCQEAMCPNQMECYGRGTATFLLLGPTCTRACTFCAVDKTRLRPPDPEEPERVGVAVARLGLRFCVLTMVTRDDLPDGGAAHVAATVRAVRRHRPESLVEVLISDLAGSDDALEVVLQAEPDVLNHNLETVPRLYPEVRPQADYRRSLRLLARVAADGRGSPKSGFMLGLGESRGEVLALLDDLAETGCRSVTIGQYLAPSPRHHPVERYVHPDEFDDLRDQALARGFGAVASAPLVRSSYQAESQFHSVGGQ